MAARKHGDDRKTPYISVRSSAYNRDGSNKYVGILLTAFLTAMALQIAKQWIAKDLEGISCGVILCTYSMEQSPSWEVNRYSATQEIPRILWNPKVHYCIHKCPPPVPILSQMSIPHIRLLILSSHLCLGLPICLFPSSFPTKTLYTSLLSPIRTTCHNSRYSLGKDLEGQRKTTINLS